MDLKGETCTCSVPATTAVEWECRYGHKGFAALCTMHAQIHVGALLSGEVRCGRCRKDSIDTAVMLQRVNGKKVDPRIGRTVL